MLLACHLNAKACFQWKKTCPRTKLGFSDKNVIDAFFVGFNGTAQAPNAWAYDKEIGFKGLGNLDVGHCRFILLLAPSLKKRGYSLNINILQKTQASFLACYSL